MTDPSALYFGPQERPLFGWLHVAPAPADAPRLGLILCNPFGYEAICAHRSIRHFAESAANAGMPALRFDYDGSGDSAGDALDAGRLTAWTTSITHAIDALRRHTGVARVALLGIRLGGALAALAASGRADVAGLITIAPIIQVKSYVRELRMLQLALEAKRNLPQESRDGVLESCGFLLAEQTQQSLASIDLMRLQAAPAADILILERAGLPVAGKWAERLLAQGARVERREIEGYEAMMLDSHETVIPQTMIQASVAWLRGLAAAQPASTQQAVAPVTMASEAQVRMGEVTETAVRFGPAQGPALFGIVTAATDLNRHAGGGRKAVLLLNAGAVHRVGPNRLYVELARHWARSGHVALRFDIAGIGDSAPRAGKPENIVYPPEAIEDLTAAIDHLHRAWQITEFHAVGLCAGAYHAFKAAVGGLPLAGVVLINPLTFYWREGMSLKYPDHRIASDMMRYQANVWRPASWLKLLKGQVHLGELFQVLARRATCLTFEPLRALGHILRIPMRKDLGADLGRAAARGIDLQFVFAALEPGIELLRNKGGYAARRLRAQGRLKVEVISGTDHTFTDREPRAALARFLAAKLDGPAREPA